MVPTRVAIGMLRLGSFEQRSFLCMAGAGWMPTLCATLISI